MLGREPREITRHYYKKGHLVRSVTTREAEWTEDDIAWHLAYLAELADKCSGCKQPLSETTAMADGGPVHSYRVDAPIRCYGCDELAKQQEAHKKKGRVIRPEALLWPLERV